MRRSILFLFLVLFLFPANACERVEPAKTAAMAQSVEQVAPAPNEADAYFEFLKLRKARPIDFIAMETLYSERLATYIEQADQRFGVELDGEISRALAESKAGKNIYGNAQIAEKLVQYAFYLHFDGALTALQAQPGEAIRIVEIEQAAPVIDSTTLRRSRWVGQNDEYQVRLKAMLNEMKAGKTQAVDSLRSLLLKVYLLSTIYELDGLTKARGQDADKTAEKVAEARAYFRFIDAEVKRRDDAGRQTVVRQLALTPEEMDLDLIKQILARTFAAELADIQPDRIGLPSK